MSPWITAPILIIAVNVLWQIGGQFWKPARRYMASLCGAAYLVFTAKDYAKDKQKRTPWGYAGLVFLGLMGLLSMGYGEDSKLKKWLGGSEWLTRLAMASLIASVFVGYSVSMHHIGIGIPLTYGVNVLAWQVRWGSICKVGKYDILGDDICRATACAISVIMC